MAAIATRATAKQMLDTAPEWVSRLPHLVSGKMEEGVNLSKQAIKHARSTAEDLLDDAARQIKRHPWQTAAICVGVGLGLGVVLGRAFAPRRRWFQWWK